VISTQILSENNRGKTMPFQLEILLIKRYLFFVLAHTLKTSKAPAEQNACLPKPGAVGLIYS
jgi:hypothetical protein